MQKFFLFTLLNLCFFTVFGQKKSINVTTELNKLSNIQDLPTYWDDTEVKQISSYDTTGNNDDGFSGKYSFIRKNQDSSLVIFEAEGNGVINRIWTPTPNSDVLDFYFSGSDEPSFSIPFIDLFSGKVFPFVSPVSGNEIGGYYCYFPIPFKDGCKIVSRGKSMKFYQIQYRSYPKQYKVENFSENIGESARAALKALVTKWGNVGDLAKHTTINTETTLKPGQTLTLAEINHGGRILGIELHPAEAFTGLNKQVDLKITWDDEKEPAIYMPVADFFGFAFGEVSMQSLLLGTANNASYCYIPMPFDDNAKVELIYRSPYESVSGEPIKVKADLFVSKEKRHPKKEGKLYTYWNRNKNAPLGEPHLFLEGSGKGHYVGTILQTQGLNPGMTAFFEGDDVTKIDGEMRVHGTGSEDYFNGGWYALLDRWDRGISMPLHGSLDYSLPFSRTGGFRLFISDKMTFKEHIRHTIEHGPEQNNAPVDYTSVALYYADQQVMPQNDVPSNPLTDVYIPETFMIYPQLMRYSFAGTVKIKGGTLETTTGAGVRIDLTELPKGHYKVYADIEKSPEGAEITIWQRQAKVSEPISFYANEKTSKSKEYLCDIIIDDFKDTMTLRFKRDDERSKIRINRLILERD